jgi:FlaA1/EpsC-like NDP-sugar epimerase
LIADWENQKRYHKSKTIQIEDLLERKPIILDNKLISKQITDKTILITGAAGSIGSEIVRQVLIYNPKKLLLDQAETPLHHLRLETELLHKIKIKPCSRYRNKEAMDRVLDSINPK